MDESGIQARTASVLAATGVTASAAVERALVTWIELVRTWNARIDLTAARTDDELVDLMLADAAVLAAHVDQGARAVDVGSGAGAPGLALALLREDLDMTLVEPLQKRVSFLRTAIGTLSGVLPRGSRLPRVARGRGEDLVRRGERFDAAISRAALPPPAWLSLGARLAPEGTTWILLARDEPPALEGFRVAGDHRYAWPLTGSPRRLVGFTRAA